MSFRRPHFEENSRAARASGWALVAAACTFLAQGFVPYLPGAWYPVTGVCALLAAPAIFHPKRGRAAFAVVLTLWAAGATVNGVVDHRRYEARAPGDIELLRRAWNE
jgi:hypothetical protein